MRTEAYEQYRSEATNWLKAARAELLSTLLSRTIADDRVGGLRLLEVGAGVGQNVEVLRRFGAVDVLEVDPLGLERLHELQDVGRVFDQPIPTEIDGTYDVIVAFDVLEHIADDAAAARWIASHLNPGGHLVATVPAYQWLFSDHDVALDHYRRYTRRQLVSVLPPDMVVRRAGYFVSLLLPIAAATRIAGKVTKRLRGVRSSRGPARKQSSTVPGTLDALLRRQLHAEVRLIGAGHDLPFGLSVLCVAQKSTS